MDSKKLSDEIHKNFILHWPRSRLRTNVISETPDFCRERQSHETPPKAFPPLPPLSGKPSPTTATEPTEGAPSTQKEREREKKFPLFYIRFMDFSPFSRSLLRNGSGKEIPPHPPSLPSSSRLSSFIANVSSPHYVHSKKWISEHHSHKPENVFAI